MIDSNDKNNINKKYLASLPCRSLLIAPSGFGKSSLLGWLLCNSGEEGYKDDVLPENIYIFSGSYKKNKGSNGGDEKLHKVIKYIDIPEENIFENYDNDLILELYNMICENYNERLANNEKVDHSMLIFDDLGFMNKMNKIKLENDAINKLMCNSRKFLCSVIILNQRITQCSPTVITQANNIILWKPNNRDLEMFENNFNYLSSKKLFRKMIRKNTEDKHDFLVIDLTKKDIYRDKNFEPIKFCKCSGSKNDCGGLK